MSGTDRSGNGRDVQNSASGGNANRIAIKRPKGKQRLFAKLRRCGSAGIGSRAAARGPMPSAGGVRKGSALVAAPAPFPPEAIPPAPVPYSADIACSALIRSAYFWPMSNRLA
ncbi:MAG: hypothetical protein ABJJ73_21365, partial [Nitratireductor sp.]